MTEALSVLSMKIFPETASIHQLDNKCWLVTTSIDLSDMSMTGKIFQDFDSALGFVHDASLKQMPEWHQQYCDRCKKA